MTRVTAGKLLVDVLDVLRNKVRAPSQIVSDILKFALYRYVWITYGGTAVVSAEVLASLFVFFTSLQHLMDIEQSIISLKETIDQGGNGEIERKARQLQKASRHRQDAITMFTNKIVYTPFRSQICALEMSIQEEFINLLQTYVQKCVSLNSSTRTKLAKTLKSVGETLTTYVDRRCDVKLYQTVVDEAFHKCDTQVKDDLDQRQKEETMNRKLAEEEREKTKVLEQNERFRNITNFMKMIHQNGGSRKSRQSTVLIEEVRDEPFAVEPVRQVKNPA